MTKSLREWRALRLMTWDELSAASKQTGLAEVSVSTIGAIENHRSTPRTGTIKSLSAALGVAPDEVTEFVEAMQAHGQKKSGEQTPSPAPAKNPGAGE